jgi:hypothetical protein
MVRTEYRIGETIVRTVSSAVLALVILTGQAWGQSSLTLGHQVLIERGLQIETLCMPSYIMAGGGTFDLDLYRESNFTAMNLWNGGYNYDYFANTGVLPSGSNALPFSSLVYSSSAAVTASYASNLVRIQYGDEQSIIPTTAHPNVLTDMATEVAALKARYPNAMVYTNQSALFNENADGNNAALTTSVLNTYMQTVRPDMLSFTEYPFRWIGTPYHNQCLGGSPKEMYQHIEVYRKAGLAGLTGDGTQPIPVSMFVQTFAHVSQYTNGLQPAESQFRLQQFAGWAAGMKMVDAFLYANLPPDLDSMFFEGTGIASQTPTAQFYQYAELNRQSANLGPALVRLISTGFRMKMGSHGTSPVTNSVPSGVTTFSTTADPYLTSITATNLGTRNNGLPGDVLYGAFKPLDPSLVEAGSENDKYFMIVNGLSDVTGSAADCRQLIHLTFNFGASGIDSLLRLSRETGLVEEVALSYISGSLYSLDLTLDGGTGDLFKYNTGTAFVGTASVPEPSVIVLSLTCLFGLLAYAWRKQLSVVL